MLRRIKTAAFESIQGRVFYGWVILVVAMLGMFGTGPGQSHLIGIFFDSLATDLELPRTSVAAAYGSATLVGGILRLRWETGRPLRSRGVDVDPGIVPGTGGGDVQHGVQLDLHCHRLRLSAFFRPGFDDDDLCQSGFPMVRSKTGMALGLMSLGFPISMAVHPPLAQWLIGQVGWRESWIWLGVATWVLLLPPVLIFLFSKPEELGLKPDGGLEQDSEGGPVEIQGMTLSEALRTPAFYILCSGLFSLSMLVTSLHVENKGILTRHGLDPQTATLMFTVSGIMAAISMPIIGRMLDRFRSNLMFAGGLLVMSTSLLSVTFVEGVYSGVMYAAVFGINNGVTMTYFSFFWPRFFGRKHLGSIQGTASMIMVVGASIGPIPLAIAADFTGDYDLTLRFLALLPATFSIAALFLKHPSQEQAS
ncbi:MAG: MFS transporter [Deltaproteobacteria bacterium]|nr:MAG: MFS transporter [Deltaproteobacteria bacterium]